MTKFLNHLKIKNYKIKNSNRKLLVILGPTASGKSDLAIQLAQLFNGEIISADSRQVYRGMDIGSGKVKIQKSKDRSNQLYSEGIRHHLLDVANPQEYFSAAQYQKLALKAIKDIQKRGKLPILCGGTGLYLSSLIEGWQLPEVPPNPSLRAQLETESTEKLFQKLKQLDPQRAKTIDPHNKRRLIRALEILQTKKEIPSLKKNPPPWDLLILGIKKDQTELKKLIKERLQKRIQQGMIQEVENLKKQGVSSQRLEDFGLEYRWVNRYLEKKISYEEMFNSLYQDICHYAKRQMTWFKKMPKVNWVINNEEAIKLARDFLSN